MEIIKPTREEAVAYSWKLGRLNYRRRNTQKTIQAFIAKAQLTSRKVYIESTRRLGKSSEMLAMFAEHCIQHANWKAGFFAPVKDGLLDYIEPIIRKTFEDCPSDVYPQFNRQRFMLEWPNGSAIIFRGSNNKQHRIRRGQEFNEAGVDEARDVDELDVLIESVIMPALFSVGGYLYLWSTPADTRSHPLYRYRQQAESEGWLIKLTIWDANRLDPFVYTLPLIQEWQAETLKSIDGPDVWAREYECDWRVNKSLAAVPEWKPIYCQDVPHDPYYQFYNHYVFLDWGYRDYTAVGFGTHLFRKAALAVESELTFSGTDVRSDKIAAAIRRECVNLWGPDYTLEKMVSDSADPILINEINQHERMSFTPVQKADTLEAMLQQFRVRVNQGKILVSPKCTFTLHCLANAVWDKHREVLDQDVFARHFDHLMALVYGDRMIDYNANPIPADFMVDGVRVMNLDYAPQTQKSPNAEAFEQMVASARR